MGFNAQKLMSYGISLLNRAKYNAISVFEKYILYIVPDSSGSYVIPDGYSLSASSFFPGSENWYSDSSNLIYLNSDNGTKITANFATSDRIRYRYINASGKTIIGGFVNAVSEIPTISTSDLVYDGSVKDEEFLTTHPIRFLSWSESQTEIISSRLLYKNYRANYIPDLMYSSCVATFSGNWLCDEPAPVQKYDLLNGNNAFPNSDFYNYRNDILKRNVGHTRFVFKVYLGNSSLSDNYKTNYIWLRPIPDTTYYPDGVPSSEITSITDCGFAVDTANNPPNLKKTYHQIVRDILRIEGSEYIFSHFACTGRSDITIGFIRSNEPSDPTVASLAKLPDEVTNNGLMILPQTSANFEYDTKTMLLKQGTVRPSVDADKYEIWRADKRTWTDVDSSVASIFANGYPIQMSSGGWYRSSRGKYYAIVHTLTTTGITLGLVEIPSSLNYTEINPTTITRYSPGDEWYILKVGDFYIWWNAITGETCLNEHVTFYYDSNKTTVLQEYYQPNIGSLLSYPANQSKEHHDWAGWQGSQSTVNNTVEHEMWGTYNIWTYAVKFAVNGSIIDTQYIPYGGNATAPSADVYGPYVPTGYYFNVWYGTYTNVTSEQTVTADLQKQSFKVIWQANGGKFSDNTTEKVYWVKYQENSPVPDSPTWSGYKLTGWSTNGNNITAARTITANWEADTVTITFNSNGGSNSVPAQTKTVGQTYGSVPDPGTKSNSGFCSYVFDGWYSGSKKLTSDSTVESSDSWVASWITNVQLSIRDIPKGSQAYECHESYSAAIMLSDTWSQIVLDYNFYGSYRLWFSPKFKYNNVDYSINDGWMYVTGYLNSGVSKKAVYSVSGTVKIGPTSYDSAVNSCMTYNVNIEGAQFVFISGSGISNISGTKYGLVVSNVNADGSYYKIRFYHFTASTAAKVGLVENASYDHYYEYDGNGNITGPHAIDWSQIDTLRP